MSVRDRACTSAPPFAPSVDAPVSVIENACSECVRLPVCSSCLLLSSVNSKAVCGVYARTFRTSSRCYGCTEQFGTHQVVLNEASLLSLLHFL